MVPSTIDFRVGASAEARVMPQALKFDRNNPPIGEWRCPACGVPMLLARIEPADEVNHDQRTFECSLCGFAETTTVRFR
jgi:hypothetical protein